MQDTFARATHSAARPSARATIGYLVYKLTYYVISGGGFKVLPVDNGGGGGAGLAFPTIVFGTYKFLQKFKNCKLFIMNI